MKIKAAKVIATCPERNFVTLKIVTDQGAYGVGRGKLYCEPADTALHLKEGTL